MLDLTRKLAQAFFTARDAHSEILAAGEWGSDTPEERTMKAALAAYNAAVGLAQVGDQVHSIRMDVTVEVFLAQSGMPFGTIVFASPVPHVFSRRTINDFSRMVTGPGSAWVEDLVGSFHGWANDQGRMVQVG